MTTVNLLDVEDKVVQACMSTSKSYDKTVRDKGKGHGLGAPRNHVFATFVRTLLEALAQKVDLIETPQYKWQMSLHEFIAAAPDSKTVGELLA